MRGSSLVGILVVLTALDAAAGGYCLPPWYALQPNGSLHLTGYPEDEWVRVAVDAVPWQVAACGEERVDCVLRANGRSMQVDVQTLGASGCEDPDLEDASGGQVILLVEPSEPLGAGQEYGLVCEGEDTRYRVVTAESDAPASAPAAVTIAAAVQHRSDGGCCGASDAWEIDLEGFAGAYLEEGGYLEVLYPHGGVLALRTPADRLELPAASGTLALTPVAANGIRGVTVTLQRDEVATEGIACGIGSSQTPLLWLLAPLLWIRVRRRGISGIHRGGAGSGRARAGCVGSSRR